VCGRAARSLSLPAAVTGDLGAWSSVGIDIDRDRFEEAEFVRFSERLERCLEALRRLLRRPGFGVGDTTVGAELELFLVDREGRPLPENQAVLEQAADQRVTLELDRFNLELNPSPASLAGRPFASLGREMRDALERVRLAARGHDGRVAMIGILPTLRAEDLRRSVITDSHRYRALNHGIQRLRQEPFRIEIAGPDGEILTVQHHDVVLEGANTSFQVHLRVSPERFARAYNAAQLATAPSLAVAGNSPFFLGRRLWEETRIALFEQAVDDRDEAGRGRLAARVAFGNGWVRDGAIELFEEGVRLHDPLLPVLADEDPLDRLAAGGLPELEELRLHQSTVWLWNRAIYDAGYGGHLRVEMRALPAGPTIVDMLANAAFHVGVALAVAPTAAEWTTTMPFARANANFYQAARRGLAAKLEWPAGPEGPRRVDAAELVRLLVPEARRALEHAGVDPDEAGRLLGVVEERAASGQTGAAWQRRTVDELEPRLGHERALAAMLERYLELSEGDQPVHTWPLRG
jgi:gamma-glutamyl:cysteine ligase YbdK (ATP-grasp superfamily)